MVFYDVKHKNANGLVGKTATDFTYIRRRKSEGLMGGNSGAV